jgi:fermentation-respiration switch protein FrsA (DUF1100 family)
MAALKHARGRAAAITALTAFAAPLGAQQSADLIGDWLGTLQAGGTELRIALHFTASEDGSVTGTMDSLDQGATGIPVADVTLSGQTVSLTVPSAGARYEGQLSEEGTRIDGTWSQGPNHLPLVMERTDELPVLERPQEPKEPLPYEVLEATFGDGTTVAELAGTLTLPRSDRPAPAVVLVSGSGPQDRDETVFGHRPFLVLADHLTRKGVAVLRYDDRGVGASGGDFATATSRDFADDAGAAVAYLRQRPEVAEDLVGIIGHSEGGLIAPMVAVEDPDVAFIVLLAGPGLTGEQILYRQGELIALAGGTPRRLVEANRAAQERLFAVVRQEEDVSTARTRMEAVFSDFFASLSARDLAALGVTGDPTEYASRQIDQVLTPWFRFFLTYDPLPTLRRVQVPVLALNGEMDLQVPPRENLEAIERALREGGNDNVTVREMAGLNHLFQTSATGSPSEYYGIEETMAPAALDALTEWILARARP